MASHTHSLSSALASATSAVATAASSTAAANAPFITPVASPGVLYAYVGLLFVGGQILLPLLVITLLLSRTVVRHAVLTNFLITWIVFSFGGCFLFYAGQDSGPQPSQGVCMAQVSFTYGAPILTASGGLCLVIKFLYDFRPKKFSPGREKAFFNTLLVVPYILGGVIGLLALVNGFTHHGSLTRTFLLCELSSAADTFATPATIILVINIVSIIVIEFLIGWQILKFRRNSKVRTGDGRIVTGVPLSFYIRMGIFTCVSFLALPTAFTYNTSEANAISYLLQAAIPLLSFLIFGTQLDVMRLWAFWLYFPEKKSNYAFWRRADGQGGGGGSGNSSGGRDGGKDNRSHIVSMANSEVTMVGSSEGYGEKYGHQKSLSASQSQYEPSLRSLPPSRSASPIGHGAATTFPSRPQNSVHPPVSGRGHVRTLTPTYPYNADKPLPLPVNTPDMA